MATDFAVCLQRFLTSHLAGLRGCSPNTIASYRDTFKLLIVFFGDVRSIPPDRLTLDHIDAAAITGFLDWLETGRHNSISTRNQRLAGLSSFFRWLQSQDPARMAGCQDILAVPAKKTAQPGVNHLTVEQARRLLAAPDRSTRRGRRDATLLATLYDSAARASELAGLTVGDIRVQPPPLAVLAGKGRKIRHVPLGGNTAALLSAYLAEHGLNRPGHDDHPLFVNQHGNKLSRGGIAWIIGKYQAQADDPTLAGAALSPHVLRHSRVICTAFSARGTTESGPCRIVPHEYPVLGEVRAARPVPGSFSLRCCFDLTWLTCLSSGNGHLPGTLRFPVQITFAMHLYDAGVPLPYIRDLLGHAELATTDIYARASTEAKRKALEAAYTDVVVTDDLPEWNQDAGLLNWLASL